MSYQIRPHPVLRMPTPAQAAAMGEQKWLEAMKHRDQLIDREERDPLQFGYEPPVWKLALALMDDPNWGDREWGARVRRALGFRNPVRVVFCLGGNRASKTEFAAKCEMVTLVAVERAVCWAFHSTSDQSVSTHHKLMWKFLPPAMRREIKSETEYIAYKQKTGFSDHKLVLRNGSEQVFKFYAMDKDDAMQGPEINRFWCDELVPPDWVEDLLMRIASRSGTGLVTFTPVQGYSPTVRMVLDGAEIVLDQPAFMLPTDGKGADRARALGFGSRGQRSEDRGQTGEEDAEREMEKAHAEGRWSEPTRFELRPSTSREGLRRGDSPRGESDELVCVGPEVPKGRTFEMMPRVARCADENFAVVWFHSSDNPYGRPHEVMNLAQGRSTEFVRERVYGFANKTMSAGFPRFNRKVHVIPASAIPKEGTNYQIVDPASGRNFVMGYFRRTPEGVYLYREWPGNYEIPGVGVPGRWALPHGEKLDGRPGPAQRSFGWGLRRYKEEMARLEGWKDWKERKLEVQEWREENGTAETIYERRLDSRAASSPRVEKDRPRTLLTDFDDLGMLFELTPGDDISEGRELINDALDYDADRPIDFFNKPKFFVSEECVNTIFALETWTGADGQKGACKDFIDIIRYFFLSDCGYVTAGSRTLGGGHY